MPEVLGLRELGGEGERPCDGRAGDAGSAGSDAAPGSSVSSAWRRRAAVAIVLMLFVAVADVVIVGRAGVGARSPEPNRTTPASSPEQAARGALDAWARFASTGDIDGLNSTFDPKGPQLARLRAEAPALRSRPPVDPPYAFSATVVDNASGRSGDETVVSTDVLVSRAGESEQRFAWDVVMRDRAGQWLLWTVRDRASASRPATGAGTS